MQPTVALTITGLSPEAANKILNQWGGATATGPTENKVSKTKKETKLAKPVDEDDEEILEDDEAEDVEEDEEQDEAPEYEDVVKAFKKFMASYDDIKKGRVERMKVLKKFKVEQPSELKDRDFPAVIKTLQTWGKK